MYVVAVEIVHQPHNDGLLFTNFTPEVSFLRKTSSFHILISLLYHILISLILLDYIEKRQYTALYFAMVV